MANERSSSRPGNGKEPPDKRRKTDPSGISDLDWGDDEELFTDDQLDNIDTMISLSQQVSSHHVPKPHSGFKETSKSFGPTTEDFRTSDTRQHAFPSKTRTVGKGAGRSHSADVVQSHLKSMSGTSASKYAQRIKTHSTEALLQHSTSTSGKLEKINVPYASGSVSSSLSKPGASHKQPGGMAQHQLTPTTGFTAGSGYASPALPGQSNVGRFAESHEKNYTKLKEELSSCKEELKKLKDGQYGKDGQINILRATLKEKDSELNLYKQEKVQQLEQQARERSEREKGLSKELEKMKTQLQFKEQEIVELQTTCKKLEQKSSRSSSSGNSRSPLTQPNILHQSPQAGIRNTSESHDSTKTSGIPGKGEEFPTKRTFLATESSPKKRKSSHLAFSTTGRHSTCTEHAEHAEDVPNKADLLLQRSNRMRLSLPFIKGSGSGPCLVSKMIRPCMQISSQLQPQGLFGLLQAPPPEKDVSSSGVRLGRDLLNQSFSPARVRSTRTASGHASSDTVNTSVSDIRSLVVSRENYDRALQGLSSLLHSSSPGDNQLESLSAIYARADGAVRLLAVIEDYISKYLNMVQTAVESSSGSPTSSGPSSGTVDYSSPLDSVSSSMRALMLEGVSYANQLEKYALNALKILLILVEYNLAVRAALVYDGVKSSNTKGADVPDTSDINEPSTSNKVEPNGKEASSSRLAIIPSLVNGEFSQNLEKNLLQVVEDSQLLHQVMQMANPLLKNDHSANGDIVVTALNVLATVARGCEPLSLMRFQPLITQDILLNCLQEDLSQPDSSRFAIHCCALDMMVSLARSGEMLQLMCSFAGEDECLFLAIYHSCTSGQNGFTNPQRITLSIKVVTFLSSVISLHRNGTTRLLTCDCHCSGQVVQCITLVLQRTLQIHHQETSPACVQLLHQGLNLLHTLALHDRLFMLHYKPVRHKYVELICGLEALVRFYPGILSENVGNAIQELWDFDQDYPEGSSEGEEGELAMDI